jgi:hypothetical protein
MVSDIRETVIDIGDTVVCDWCNADYTESDESGGFLFGSHAVCPKCAPDGRERIKGYGEERDIVAECPPELSFKAWVLQLRGGDNTIRIQSWN